MHGQAVACVRQMFETVEAGASCSMAELGGQVALSTGRRTCVVTSKFEQKPALRLALVPVEENSAKKRCIRK